MIFIWLPVLKNVYSIYFEINIYLLFYHIVGFNVYLGRGMTDWRPGSIPTPEACLWINSANRFCKATLPLVNFLLLNSHLAKVTIRNQYSLRDQYEILASLYVFYFYYAMLCLLKPLLYNFRAVGDANMFMDFLCKKCALFVHKLTHSFIRRLNKSRF